MRAGAVYARMESPVGPVWVAATEAGVCAVGVGIEQPDRFFNWLADHTGTESPREATEPLTAAVTQLREYFSRIRCEFHLPLDVHGTSFQVAVWTQIARIPYGSTATYGEVAQRLNRPRAARAVGAAVGANPLPILVPCHRVVGAGGSLTGYGGGLEVKEALLRLEGVLTPEHGY